MKGEILMHTPVLMHMADALLAPSVGIVMMIVAAAALAYSVYRVKKDSTLTEQKVPLMAVMAAFVFAAQMINFTIPGTGSSGHLCGGMLLAAVLGQFPAVLSLSVVLIIQCLFFADGGLLAIGCNIFNMGVGMVLAMDESEAQKAIDILASHGDRATVIGSVTATPGVDIKLL